LVDSVYLSTREAASRLSIGASTLKKLRINGGGPAFHRIGRRVVYSSEILDEWAKRETFRTTSESSDVRERDPAFQAPPTNGKFAAPSSSQPPWTGDELAMLQWLEPLLDERLWATLHAGMSEWLAKAHGAERAAPYAQAKYMATQGSIEPLREYLAKYHKDPDLTQFINLPRLNVGQNWRPRRIAKPKQRLQPLEIAEWAREIRAIWRDHFGRKRRGRDEWTPEEFAYALFFKSVTGKWPNPLREPYPNDPNEQRWVDRAAEQNRRRG
jgi:excisionase family DNA binding protein